MADHPAVPRCQVAGTLGGLGPPIALTWAARNFDRPVSTTAVTRCQVAGPTAPTALAPTRAEAGAPTTAATAPEPPSAGHLGPATPVGSCP
ncbi:hypothetical protein [Amycolatopsis sp. NPDC021455]|uniref:hypothetical protein n=1 Tax=Amycolatopsis sp. NPDC021455 TaxID=3154901 RepID=UPI0033F9FCF9